MGQTARVRKELEPVAAAKVKGATAAERSRCGGGESLRGPS